MFSIVDALIKRVGIREDPAIVDLTKREGTVASLMEAKIISDITDKVCSPGSTELC